MIPAKHSWDGVLGNSAPLPITCQLRTDTRPRNLTIIVVNARDSQVQSADITRVTGSVRRCGFADGRQLGAVTRARIAPGLLGQRAPSGRDHLRYDFNPLAGRAWLPASPQELNGVPWVELFGGRRQRADRVRGRGEISERPRNKKHTTAYSCICILRDRQRFVSSRPLDTHGIICLTT
jgi:hypothetical protein